MSRLRAGTVAALSSALILTSAGPAAADEISDETKPVVTATGVVNGQYLGQIFRVVPEYSDNVGAAQIDFLINGEVQRSYKQFKGIRSFPVPLDPKFDGREVDFTVRVLDAAGNAGEAVTRVNVDLVAPVATFSPDGYGDRAKGIMTITATGVSKDAVTITSSEGHRVTSAPWVFTWDTTPYANDIASIGFRVIDRAGNSTVYHQQHYIDDTGPKIEVRSLPSVTGTQATYLYAYAVDDRTATTRFEWWIDGVLRSTTQSSFQHNFGTKDRVSTVTIKAWDKWGNASSTTRKVTVDATGPAVSWISPKSGALLRGSTVTTAIRAVDAHAGTTKALLHNNASGYHTCKPICSTKALLSEGKQDLVWSVYDQFGNVTVVRRPVIVDNTKPSLKVTKAPKNKAKVKGTVKITAAASDRNGVARVELLVNGKVVAKDSKVAYRFSVNTRKYGKKIKVQLRAYDRAGNVRTTSTRTWYRR
ncbi:Ig-like domain-containing protein [Actinoplanes missouriensis]|uniref:Ig-like domain-containing protein n=1 Tax=Actinoplanes missouriensis TaxID=1866 RepID=UPI0002FD9DB4|nr:Ig-like domain-containing protein [Actinoplanes missouriensis]